MVMVFYLLCWKSRIILVNAVFCYTLYIYIQSSMIFIQKSNPVIFFEITLAHLYTYIHIKIYIYIIVIHFCGAFFLANICQLWINPLHQILFPSNFVHNLSSSILTWQTHLVTHPQIIITPSVVNNSIQSILRFSVIFYPFGNMPALRGLEIISVSVSGVMSYFRVSILPKLHII